MSTTHKARRRTLRTAVIAAAVLAGISVPIGAAAAQSPTAPAASTLPGPADTGTGDVDNAGRGQARRVEAGSKQLPGGYVAHLYKNMKGSAVTGWEAEIHRVKAGGLATTLTATRTTVTAKADGRTFTLTPSGRVFATTTPGGKPDKPQDRIQPRTVKLRDGGIAKISKNANGTFKATLHDRKDTRRAAIDSRTEPTAVLASGLKVTLTPGGNITQHWSKSRPADNAQLKLKLRDGNTALVEKGTDKIWGATLWSATNDGFLDGIHATKRPTVTLPSGLKATISNDGTLAQTYKGTTTRTPATGITAADAS
ncbi:hypothetical protein ACFRJ1_04045 [Streptomyces sp. NPDC056773]|uniref:hypothetical protein n=1 Tax=unclassified Streptomyces TaxID=2593676 RepID=UPI00369C12B6